MDNGSCKVIVKCDMDEYNNYAKWVFKYVVYIIVYTIRMCGAILQNDFL